ncbi:MULTISPECIES: hypothetical protein [Caproicibacterium]|uniref:Uncharacterized protein n=1 Tax=Caproicibacterium argilliputei TaxID=3030016 RepID=A0AA97H253_9FIRM|nr:hypothetical protein [Caproicibacterium argilliputei]WOC32385.1 hypothetical protein PXC00_00525 [Caproicibacterium argilliputei]
MIKIRLTGLPSEIRAMRDKLRTGSVTISKTENDANYQVSNCSTPTRNRGSKYVRMYADVEKTENGRS